MPCIRRCCIDVLVYTNADQDLEIHEDEIRLLETDNCIRTRQDTADCGCPEQIVSQKDSRTIFRDLYLSEEYFPMIARINARAFFGLPPQGLRPKGREEGTFTVLTTGPRTRVSARPGQSRPVYVEEYDGNDELYGVSDGDGDYMQVDLPYRSSPSQGPSTTTEPAEAPTEGLSTKTSVPSGKHVSQITQTPNRPIAAENNPEIARLKVRYLIRF
jgi:hypothetical protein